MISTPPLTAAAPQVRSATVLVNGHRLHYRSAGSGPVVLLVHGIAGSGATWKRLLQPLAQGHRVIALDLLGHGLSAKPRGDYSLAGHASVVRDFLDALGIADVSAVGHSYGGGVVMQLLYQYPERVNRLVLISSGGLGPEVTPLLRLAAVQVAEPLTRYVLRAAMALPAGGRVPRRLRDAVWPRRIEDFLPAMAEPGGCAAFFNTVRGVIDFRGQRIDATGRLPHVRDTPVLAIWGDADRILPVAHIRTLEAVATAQLHVLPRVGHFPHEERAEEVTALIQDFLAQPRRRPARPLHATA
ncbi:alpha/beta fold hydrolase [Jatrophihabitans sp.]|jgi:pimeloyl-ACP methyl ester carboxylesterase|uniref:alpha/beta fold hydrolase n=1 Tax=Jatrophihabitans sp. TaxID=1932789 RepID=UPI002F12A8F9